MSTAPLTTPFASDLTWDVARLFPPQGQWSEGEYLTLTDAKNQLVELVAGRLEFPPMPTKSHQKMARFLCNEFLAFMEPRRLGDAVTAPYRIRLPDGQFREPDVVVYLQEHLDRFRERFGEGADLVVEIVSEGAENRERDLDVKPEVYAKAGIPEYWIVDPQERQVIVLTLQNEAYHEHGRFDTNEPVTSVLLDGFSLPVEAIFAAGASSKNV